MKKGDVIKLSSNFRKAIHDSQKRAETLGAKFLTGVADVFGVPVEDLRARDQADEDSSTISIGYHADKGVCNLNRQDGDDAVQWDNTPIVPAEDCHHLIAMMAEIDATRRSIMKTVSHLTPACQGVDWKLNITDGTVVITGEKDEREDSLDGMLQALAEKMGIDTSVKETPKAENVTVN